MNKFLKILTLTGLTATLSATGLSLTNLNLKTNYKLNAEIDNEASDYVARKTEENNDDTISFSENGENNVNINENTMDEHNNPVLHTDNSANINPTIEETSQTENNSENNVPSTLEETENNVVNPNSEADTESNSNENTDNSLNIGTQNNTETNQTSEENISENNQANIQYISEDKYNDIISSYDEIKEEIEELITESQKIAENHKNEQNSLTEQQIQEVQAKSEEINSLLRDVEQSLNELSCTLTGDCDTTSETNYHYELVKLNNKVNMLQSAMQAYTNPAFRFYQNPYGNIYGFSYYYSPNLEEFNQSEESSENSNQTDDVAEDDKNESINKKTFNLPNNLDTYGPTRRNIDTFFNTALLDENGMYNNFTPYGYGGYNNFGYGNFGMNNFNQFNNSNYQNKENLRSENTASNTPLTVETSDENDQATLPEEIGKKRPRIEKNIDTYNAKTMEGNINSMGGMKVTDYLKEKFNKWFNKKDKQDQVNSYVDNFIEEHQKTENTKASIFDDLLENKEKQNIYW